ncbi:hypothetical protein [uncultured Enterovirga sp.]|uniref:hypothetical protein n=1 Tax=uncultured Enterovirga sp. TaxID=2026352 RepID=UPI0035C9EA99
MARGLRLRIRRYVVVSYLADLSHDGTERRVRNELGGHVDDYSQRGLREGWSSRTTAAVLAAVRFGKLALDLDHDRRMRIGRVLSEQDSGERAALAWLVAFNSGRLNGVGIDSFVLRYNYTSGLLASWIIRGKAVDPRVRPIFIAVSAWALAGVARAEIDQRLEELLDGMKVPAET